MSVPSFYELATVPVSKARSKHTAVSEWLLCEDETAGPFLAAVASALYSSSHGISSQ